VSPNTMDAYYPLFIQTFEQIEPGSSDIAIGVLPYISYITDVVENTIPHLHIKLLWYVPCPNPASRWTSIHKIFGSLFCACFSAVAILAVIIMWLLAKYETQLHVRESPNYKTIIYCIYNVWAILTGVSVPQKPISLSLRIFFIAWVWYSVAMTTVYQAFFIGLLVNPGFEKSITTLNDLIQSGIEYGYVREINASLLSDPLYEIIVTNRKTCKSPYKCLQRVIERKEFCYIIRHLSCRIFQN